MEGKFYDVVDPEEIIEKLKIYILYFERQKINYKNHNDEEFTNTYLS